MCDRVWLVAEGGQGQHPPSPPPHKGCTAGWGGMNSTSRTYFSRARAPPSHTLYTLRPCGPARASAHAPVLQPRDFEHDSPARNRSQTPTAGSTVRGRGRRHVTRALSIHTALSNQTPALSNQTPALSNQPRALSNRTRALSTRTRALRTQVIRCADEGFDMVRVTVVGMKDAKASSSIVRYLQD